jgi:3-oxoacyl-[acyl-carrier protein] reductase
MNKKSILVTGGSRGIGRATVKSLAISKKYDVTFTYKSNVEQADSLLLELEKEGLQVRSLKVDFENYHEAEKIVQHALEACGGFDGIVLNAGFAQDSPLYFMTYEQWNSVLQVSLNSFFILTKLAIPRMIERRWGRIVTLSSISGESGNRGQANYAAAKGAIIAATKSLAKEVGAKGVLVNSVSPGLIETDMTTELHIPKDELKRMIPLGRMGRPEEVANVIAFLLSEEASYINGEVLRVNGGLYT